MSNELKTNVTAETLREELLAIGAAKEEEVTAESEYDGARARLKGAQERLQLRRDEFVRLMEGASDLEMDRLDKLMGFPFGNIWGAFKV